jgi:CheY-like chemotaxis protein
VFELTLVASSAGIPDGGARPVPGVVARTRTARLLAVDDDDDVVEFIVAYLEPFGFDVATATTSAQALEIAGSRELDLVLCDVGMPKQSGFDLARALRDRGYRGKIVLMTGWDTPTLGNDVRAVHCDMLLKKPFVGADLIRVLDALLAS